MIMIMTVMKKIMFNNCLDQNTFFEEIGAVDAFPDMSLSEVVRTKKAAVYFGKSKRLLMQEALRFAIFPIQYNPVTSSLHIFPVTREMWSDEVTGVRYFGINNHIVQVSGAKYD